MILSNIINKNSLLSNEQYFFIALFTCCSSVSREIRKRALNAIRLSGYKNDISYNQTKNISKLIDEQHLYIGSLKNNFIMDISLSWEK